MKSQEFKGFGNDEKREAKDIEREKEDSDSFGAHRNIVRNPGPRQPLRSNPH